MAIKKFSLRALSLSSVTWFATVVLGVPLIGAAVWHVITSASLGLAPSFVMVAMLVAALELMPLVQGRGHDPQGVVMSTSFTFGMLFVWGLWPTVILVSIGSLLADARQGKQWWKFTFNPAQYAISVAAADLVIQLSGRHASLAHPWTSFQPIDLTWMAASWLVYFAVNVAVVSAVLTFDSTFRENAFADIGHEAMMTLSVLALSPLIVILAQDIWPVIPLLVIPLLMIYYTAQLALEREHEAGHDSLTGLPNRATLKYVLELALASRQRGGPPFSLMLLDLDDFKTVNDALGHHAGDKLLTEFAIRIKAALRPDDVVARLGGDEFAIVAFDVDAFESCVVAQRMREQMTEPVDIEGVPVEVRFSVGVALCPQHGEDPAELLRHADVAMFRAKAAHTGLELYSPEVDQNMASRLGLLGDLRTAVGSTDLELHYQPKLGSHREIIGVEALIRWRHETRGWVPPDEFIPLAERSGIMPALTAHVIEMAMAQLALWRAEGLETKIAVNVSPSDLVGRTLVEVVSTKLVEYDIPATLLQLEITERVLTEHLDSSRRTLDSLRAMGVGISLDDFGTGYSSLMRVNSLPVDEIKIDRVFVKGLHDDPKALGIVRALIGLAHSLDVPAIAEGVETGDQLRLLESLDCDGVQGWHISKPMSGEVTTEWMRGFTPASVGDAEPAAEVVSITRDDRMLMPGMRIASSTLSTNRALA